MSLPGRVSGRVEALVRRRARAAAAGAGAVAAFAAAVTAVLLWSAAGGEAPPGLERQFRDAGRAAAEGRMDEAARLYAEVTRRGYASAEVFYNLGNAHLKAGRPGLAVLNYRKAWRLAPRDPDVGVNLRLALQASGAAEPDLSLAEMALTQLSEWEWAAAGTVAWWAAILCLCLAFVVRGRRRVPLWIAATAATAVVAALWGLWTWRGFEQNPELVVLHDRQNALAAPLASSSPRFSLPEGSVVRSRGQQGEWADVTHGQLSGWVRRAACAPARLEASD